MKVLYLCFMLSSICSTVLLAQGNKRTAQKFSIQQADSLFSAKQWKAAISAYEVVLKNQPENSLAWNRLGYCYHNLLEYDKAISKYNESLVHNPNVSMQIVLYSRLARVYAVKKETDKAFEYLDKALHAGYSNLNELQAEHEFDDLRKDARFEEVKNRAKGNAYPCTINNQARQFDFWIGEWDAFVTGTTNLAGHSRIESASGGCAILENWTSVGSPFEGKSINFVDPISMKWKQIWVGSNGTNVSEFINGEYKDGAMRFDFEETNAQGVKRLIHFFFFNQGPDQVRQFHETSTDAGKTWIATYDFTYKRKK